MPRRQLTHCALAMRMSTAAWLLAAVLSALQLGCDKGKPVDNDRTSVSGLVTFNGQPLPAGTISFQSTERGIGTPTSIRQGGRYSTDRVPIGPNAVSIESESIKYGNPAQYVPIPAKYADPSTSGLTANVETGENVDVNFVLKEQ